MTEANKEDILIHEEIQEDSEDLVPDAVLQVETATFFVNRKRLAQLSPYFRALFFGGGRESSKRHIEIKGVDLDHFRSLMDYTQNLRLHLDRRNVLGVLETANFLQVEKARLLCCKFLERELHLSNCLGMMAYAWQLGCLELYAAAREVVLTHLPALASEEDFMHLSKETIADLLASDDLFVPREDLAFEVTLRWATYDPSREDDFLELAGLVRPEDLSLPYITDLLTKMKSSDPRAKLIYKLNDHIPTSWAMGRSMPRTRSREMLFVLGGSHEQDQQSLYQFNPRSGRWQSLPPLQRKCLTQYSVAAVGNNIVVTGGYFRDVLWYSVDWVRIYECSNERWVDGPALQKSRHSHCSVALEFQVFVLGGSMDEGLVPDVESYDLLTTELNGAIYLLGGKALRLDIDTDEWTILDEELLDRKFFTACSTVNGQIYLISERKFNKVHTNMVLFDPYTDTCIEMTDAIPCPVPIRGYVTVRLMDR
ncbi:kelch-like protein 21 isoform X3 [Clarias gariepinus]|uniref:kelch-like protein 21 isoform X3 n=1 Tax=Clarias gariepinus TaxID=13013 RepID=UPI00234C76BE|nr:kelch-like protein 21 isoform X3 [Clarias gariepinus]